MNADRDRFETFVRRFRHCYRSIDIRAICGKKEGQWRNVWTKAELRWEAPDRIQSERDLPDTDAILAIHEIRPADCLLGFVSDIERGTLKLGGVDLEYYKGPDHQATLGLPLDSYDYYSRRDRFGVIVPHRPWAVAHLTGRGPDAAYAFGKKEDELNDLLRSMRVPYDGLEDLFTSFLDREWRSIAGPGRSAVVVSAPLPLRFGQCVSEEGKVHVELESAPEFLASYISVGFVEILPDGKRRRHSRELERGSWRQQGNMMSVDFEVDAAPSARIAVILSVDGTVVERVEVREPTMLATDPRLVAHTVFDDNYGRLLESLRGHGKDPARYFERGVAWLLHLCGMSAAHYGTLRRDEVDVVAFCERPQAIVAAECTLTFPDTKDKLSKLFVRCKGLNDAIGETSVLPAIFTALRQEDVPPDNLKTAEAEEISIMAAEDIEELFHLATQGVSAEKALEFIRSRAPEEGRHPWWASRLR